MTLPADDVRALAELARTLGLGLLEVADTGWSLRISGLAAAGAMPPSAAPGPVCATSPGVGTFLLAHPARTVPFHAEGEAVAVGAVLGLVVGSTVCRAVLAPCSGILARCLQPVGAAVDFGTPLFAIVPARKDQT